MDHDKLMLAALQADLDQQWRDAEHHRRAIERVIENRGDKKDLRRTTEVLRLVVQQLRTNKALRKLEESEDDDTEADPTMDG